MEEIKPKKERKFLKAMGEVALTLLRELVLGIGKKVINKVGNKRQGLAIALVMVAGVSYAAIDSIPYPITGNKQKLGWQTSGNGLVYRGTAADTVTKPSNYTNKDIKAYLLVDTVNNVMYSYIASKGGWKFNNSDTVIINNNFTQPFDSLFFKTSVATNNVDTAKMRWDSDLGTVVLGMYDKVPNELGFKNFWLVKNQTGSTITKGSIVYANGTVGASGRITVAKFIADGSIESKYLLGITAHDLTDGEDGYVISFGKIRQVNTDTFAAGAILYPSPTVAGVWTDVEPVAPNIDMPIGFCINSHVNNGTIAIRVASGYKLSELHDLAITSPVNKASLYYTGGLWRDTTATLLVSDTATMLTPYFRDADTTSLNLTSRFAAKENTITAGTTGQYFRGDKTFQTLDKTAVGLGNVDNTSDANKPLSTATQTALDAKQNTLVSGTNIKTVNSNNLLGSGNISVGTVTSVGGTGTVNGITLTGTVTSSGNLTLGGTLSGVSLSSQVSGTLLIANGGTGATTDATARTALGATVRGANTFILPDIGAISFLRYNADNTVSQRAADGMRSDLGGTIVGQSMFTLTNPSAITFPRFNANNTVTALSAADFRTAIGAGTSSTNGTVTSVTGTAPISVATGTTTPAITIANAGASTTGVVTASTQTFGGTKTFNGTINAGSELAVTGISNLNGGATIGTMATTSTLTHILGVNSSNAIGEIALGTGLSLSSGTLTATAGNDVNTYLAINGPGITLSSSFGVYSHWYVNINQASTVTITLPSASGNTNKTLVIKNTGSGAVNSQSTNIEPLNSTSLTDAILVSGGGKYATLVSNGTNWIKMSGN